MSNKFTSITSGGNTIPVWDKDAHSAIDELNSKYNETVLWQGAEKSCEASASQSVTLTESLNNFEKVRIISTYNGWNSTDSRPTIVSEADLTINALNSTIIDASIVLHGSGGDSHIISYNLSFNMNGNTITSFRPHDIRISGTSIIQNKTDISIGPIKVIGVNRKV